jgi:hypothetical protein
MHKGCKLDFKMLWAVIKRGFYYTSWPDLCNVSCRISLDHAQRCQHFDLKSIWWKWTGFWHISLKAPDLAGFFYRPFPAKNSFAVSKLREYSFMWILAFSISNVNFSSSSLQIFVQFASMCTCSTLIYVHPPAQHLRISIVISAPSPHGPRIVTKVKLSSSRWNWLLPPSPRQLTG